MTRSRAVAKLDTILGIADWSNNPTADEIMVVYMAVKDCEDAGVGQPMIARVLREGFFPQSLLRMAARAGSLSSA